MKIGDTDASDMRDRNGRLLQLAQRDKLDRAVRQAIIDGLSGKIEPQAEKPRENRDAG